MPPLYCPSLVLRTVSVTVSPGFLFLGVSPHVPMWPVSISLPPKFVTSPSSSLLHAFFIHGRVTPRVGASSKTATEPCLSGAGTVMYMHVHSAHGTFWLDPGVHCGPLTISRCLGATHTHPASAMLRTPVSSQPRTANPGLELVPESHMQCHLLTRLDPGTSHHVSTSQNRK